jgi:hypothetical protein
MRDEVIQEIQKKNFNGFRVSRELPFEDADQPLFLRNTKTIYVDNPQTVEEPLFTTMDSKNVNTEVTSVTVYYSSDAKNQPANYYTVLSGIKSLRDQFASQGYFRREAAAQTSIQGDNVVTEIELQFTKLI